jgi:hypothetical protein
MRWLREGWFYTLPFLPCFVAKGDAAVVPAVRQASGQRYSLSGLYRRQSPIDGIRSPFRFEGNVRQAVYQLKYRNIRILSDPSPVDE